MNKYDAIDERYFKDFRGVLIQEYPSNEMRMVKLSDEDNEIFNRNIEGDLQKLWELYETNPEKYQI
jgi:hypothetical protein